MKKILLTAALVAMASSAFAATGAPFTNKAVIGVAGTAHDLGVVNGADPAMAGTQKCIYCHTPHNAQREVPLWNRNAPTAISAYYNSPTLTTAAMIPAAGLDANSISVMCMSCHDGATAYNNIQRAVVGANAGNDFPNDNSGSHLAAASKANLLAGTYGLSNDHPVGFNYESAAQEEISQYGPGNEGLRVIGTANSMLGQNAFFGTGTGFGQQMECSSCHKVHDDRKAPFLRISNDTSQLCLACHIK